MKKIIYLLIIHTIIIGCINEKQMVSFEVYNGTYNNVSDITISNGVNDIYIDTIMPNMTKSVKLSFLNVPKLDGGYKLSYKLNSEEFFKNFGYYSNGIPSASVEYKIKIMQDTIQIKEVFKK
jgi:hypothetical protein